MAKKIEPKKDSQLLEKIPDLKYLKNLARKEKLFNQIIRKTSEAIVILDQNRRIILWSNGAEQVFGYKESEVLNESINILIPINKISENEYLLEEVEEKSFVKNHETHRISRSGELIEVSISVSKVVDTNNEFIGYLVIYLDITDQRKATEELQKRFEAMQDAYKELGLQKRQMDYLIEIIEATVNPKINLENLEKLIVSAACMLTKCDGAVLRLKDGKYLKLKSCLGIHGNWWNKDQINIKNSIAEEAFQNARPLILHNLNSQSKHQGPKLVKSHGFRALIMIPLYIGNKLIGSLSLYTAEPSAFRLIETDFLETFGKQCSIALSIKIR